MNPSWSIYLSIHLIDDAAADDVDDETSLLSIMVSRMMHRITDGPFNFPTDMPVHLGIMSTHDQPLSTLCKFARKIPIGALPFHPASDIAMNYPQAWSKSNRFILIILPCMHNRPQQNAIIIQNSPECTYWTSLNEYLMKSSHALRIELLFIRN